MFYKLRVEGAAAVVVFPYWTSAPWWPTLLELKQGDILEFVDTPAAIIPLTEDCEALRNKHWRLAAALVPGSASLTLPGQYPALPCPLAPPPPDQ